MSPDHRSGRSQRRGPSSYAMQDAERLWEILDPRPGQGLANLTTMAADLREPLPLQNQTVDLCLAATVLHVIKHTLADGRLLREIFRVLRPGGRLAVLNCSLADLSYGPPAHLRTSPAELDELALPQGFTRERLEDMGFNYLAVYGKK